MRSAQRERRPARSGTGVSAIPAAWSSPRGPRCPPGSPARPGNSSGADAAGWAGVPLRGPWQDARLAPHPQPGSCTRPGAQRGPRTPGTAQGLGCVSLRSGPGTSLGTRRGHRQGRGCSCPLLGRGGRRMAPQVALSARPSSAPTGSGGAGPACSPVQQGWCCGVPRAGAVALRGPGSHASRSPPAACPCQPGSTGVPAAPPCPSLPALCNAGSGTASAGGDVGCRGALNSPGSGTRGRSWPRGSSPAVRTGGSRGTGRSRLVPWLRCPRGGGCARLAALTLSRPASSQQTAWRGRWPSRRTR